MTVRMAGQRTEASRARRCITFEGAHSVTNAQEEMMGKFQFFEKQMMGKFKFHEKMVLIFPT